MKYIRRLILFLVLVGVCALLYIGFRAYYTALDIRDGFLSNKEYAVYALLEQGKSSGTRYHPDGTRFECKRFTVNNAEISCKEMEQDKVKAVYHIDYNGNLLGWFSYQRLAGENNTAQEHLVLAIYSGFRSDTRKTFIPEVSKMLRPAPTVVVYVGSSDPSDYGKSFADQRIQELAKRGSEDSFWNSVKTEIEKLIQTLNITTTK
ncbi:MAG TPA: hypothetical protein VEA59_02285 [Patescibacteria group bacterium]|nr:hypothetical protein [Patescibacteria group bacterium]